MPQPLKLISPSSGIEHKTQEAFLAELLMNNAHPETKDIPFFWRNELYRESYAGRLVTIKKHLSAIGFDPIYRAIIKHSLKAIGMNEIDVIIEELE